MRYINLRLTCLLARSLDSRRGQRESRGDAMQSVMGRSRQKDDRYALTVRSSEGSVVRKSHRVRVRVRVRVSCRTNGLWNLRTVDTQSMVQ